jgi:hypothetical protein
MNFEFTAQLQLQASSPLNEQVNGQEKMTVFYWQITGVIFLRDSWLEL